MTPDLFSHRTAVAVALSTLPVCLAVAACGPQEPAPGELPRVELICDRDYLPAMEQLAEQATERLEVAQWEFFASQTTNDLIAALGAAVDRGVAVRLLLDDSIEENEQAVERFEAVGVDARLDSSQSDKIHVKLLVADGSTALVGSTNWSRSAIDFNRECNLLVRDGGAPAYLDAWFDQLWESPWLRTPPATEQVDGAPATALVDDDLLEHLLARLDEATTRIDFTLYATWLQPDNPAAPAMQVFQKLADAAARGVTVRGVADWSNWNSENNESNETAATWLGFRGVDMRWDDPAVNMHAKGFLVDSGLQIQSANVSSSGFAYNHEAGAWTQDEETIQDFEAWFEELWEESTESPP